MGPKNKTKQKKDIYQRCHQTSSLHMTHGHFLWWCKETTSNNHSCWLATALVAHMVRMPHHLFPTRALQKDTSTEFCGFWCEFFQRTNSEIRINSLMKDTPTHLILFQSICNINVRHREFMFVD